MRWGSFFLALFLMGAAPMKKKSCAKIEDPPILSGTPIDVLDFKQISKEDTLMVSRKYSLDLVSLGGGITEKDQYIVSRLLQEVLETGMSFLDNSWSNLDSGHRGVVSVRPSEDRLIEGESFKCRGYEVLIVIDRKNRTFKGRACRDQDSRWFFID
jgi:surface antigen